MMPKIGDISSDWQLIARGKKDSSHYKYIYRCQACGDEATRYRASPPHSMPVTAASPRVTTLRTFV